MLGTQGQASSMMAAAQTDMVAASAIGSAGQFPGESPAEKCWHRVVIYAGQRS